MFAYANMPEIKGSQDTVECQGSKDQGLLGLADHEKTPALAPAAADPAAADIAPTDEPAGTRRAPVAARRTQPELVKRRDRVLDTGLRLVTKPRAELVGVTTPADTLLVLDGVLDRVAVLEVSVEVTLAEDDLGGTRLVRRIVFARELFPPVAADLAFCRELGELLFERRFAIDRDGLPSHDVGNGFRRRRLCDLLRRLERQHEPLDEGFTLVGRQLREFLVRELVLLGELHQQGEERREPARVGHEIQILESCHDTSFNHPSHAFRTRAPDDL